MTSLSARRKVSRKSPYCLRLDGIDNFRQKNKSAWSSTSLGLLQSNKRDGLRELTLFIMNTKDF